MPPRWGVWSDWIWHEQYQRYYRQRQDTNGQLDYQWHDPDATNAQEIPRESDYNTLYDTLADTLDGTHIHNTSAANYDHFDDEYTITGGSSNHKSKSASKGKSRGKSSSSRSKGKAPVTHYDDEDTERETLQGSPSSSSVQPQYYFDPETQQYYPYPQASQQADAEGEVAQEGGNTRHGGSGHQVAPDKQPRHYYDPVAQQYYEYPPTTQPPTTHAYSEPITTNQQYYDYPKTTQGHNAPMYPEHAPPTSPTAGQYVEEYDEEEDPVLSDVVKNSHQYNYGASGPGESSNSAYGYYEDEDECPSTPKQVISGTGGHSEVLDPRYCVEPSAKFNPGEIFKVLWSEPQGSGNEGGTPSISDRFEVKDKFGGRIFVGFRRFIVIANDLGHCTCVPILTYGGKACNKRGIKPEKHGIVYQRGQRAKLLPGEPKLGFAPVKIQMTEEGETLSRESRANYSKLVTVEHNVKVLFVGRIVSSDWDIVSEAVNKCWEDKIHHSRRQFDR